MTITNCDLQTRMETPQRAFIELGTRYINTSYKVIEQTDDRLTIKVFTCLASGVRFINGQADFEEGVLDLFAETESSDTIAFEQLAWELTYTLTVNGTLNIKQVSFQDSLIQTTT